MLLKDVQIPMLHTALQWQRGEISEFIAPSNWVNYDLRHLTDKATSRAAIEEALSIGASTASATLPRPPAAPPRSHVHRSRSPSMRQSSDKDICERYELDDDAMSFLDRCSPSERSRISFSSEQHRCEEPFPLGDCSVPSIHSVGLCVRGSL